jgi:hypothetical protein
MKIRPARAELFHADRVTREGVALRNFANTPKNLTFAVVVYVNKRLNMGAEDGGNKQQ